MRLPVGAARTGGAYSRALDRAIALPLSSQATLAAVIATSIAPRTRPRWPTCLCTAPVVSAIAGTMDENAAIVLPDLSRHR